MAKGEERRKSQDGGAKGEGEVAGVGAENDNGKMERRVNGR